MRKLWQRIKCYWGRHGDVGMYSDMAGTSYYCLECEEWLDPYGNYKITLVYGEDK